MLAARTLPPIIRDYSQRYTDVQVVLRDLSYRDALDAVDQGSADFAVLSLERSDSRFRLLPLIREDVVLVAPANHPLNGRRSASMQDIAAHPLLVIEQYASMHERIAAELQRHGVAFEASTTVSNLNTLLGMLNAGMGATLLTRSVARRSQKDGHSIVEIDGMTLVREFGVVRARKHELGTAAQSFIRFLKKATAGRGTETLVDNLVHNLADTLVDSPVGATAKVKRTARR